MKKTVFAGICMGLLGAFSQGVFSGAALAQSHGFIKEAPWPAKPHGGALYPNAWAGGLNNPQVSQADLNGDGRRDLFVFDRASHTVLVFLDSAQSGAPDYKYNRAFSALFPAMRDWVLAADYNGDGLTDLFASTSQGLTVYRNTGTASVPAFTRMANYIEAHYGSFTSNLYISRGDIPAILDIDGDGDLDILTFELGLNNGDAMWWFRNLSRENYGHSDSLEFVLEKRCWGRFREAPDNCTVTLNDTLVEPCRKGESPVPSARDLELRAAVHQGSTTLIYDFNGDGLCDALVGDIGCTKTYMMLNAGTGCTLARMNSVTNNFPPSQPIDLPNFPATFLADVDGDGRMDLLAAPNAFNSARNTNNLWYYRDVATSGAPDFRLKKENFLVEGMLDFGEGAMPVVVDVNGDGLKDIVVGNYGVFISTGNYRGSLAVLLNMGTQADPVFAMSETNLWNLAGLGLNALAPAFGDLDGDGDLDMLLGDLNGEVHYFKNTAGAGNAMSMTLHEAQFGGIDVGQFAMPFLVDYDGDGLLDLFLGERGQNINYFKNTGSKTVPAFTWVTDSVGKINNDYYGHFSLHIQDLNGHGKMDLLMGREDGSLLWYEMETDVQQPFRLLDSMVVSPGERLSVGMGLLDADTIPDLVLGHFRGGLSVWKLDTTRIPTGLDLGPVRNQALTVYPNPSNGEFRVHGAEPGSVFTVYSTSGRMLVQGALSENGGVKVHLPQGTYIMVLESNNGARHFANILIF